MKKQLKKLLGAAGVSFAALSIGTPVSAAEFTCAPNTGLSDCYGGVISGDPQSSFTDWNIGDIALGAAADLIGFFATAGLASALARYARTSEQIAAERGVDLANLSQINEIVIRDMQDGIVVVDRDGRIRQHNPRATQLLGPLPPARWPMLSDYAPEIAHLLEGWRKGNEPAYMQVRTPRSGASSASLPSALHTYAA